MANEVERTICVTERLEPRRQPASEVVVDGDSYPLVSRVGSIPVQRYLNQVVAEESSAACDQDPRAGELCELIATVLHDMVEIGDPHVLSPCDGV